MSLTLLALLKCVQYDTPQICSNTCPGEPNRAAANGGGGANYAEKSWLSTDIRTISALCAISLPASSNTTNSQLHFKRLSSIWFRKEPLTEVNKNLPLTLHPNPLLLGKLSELIIKCNQHLNNCVCKMVLFYWPTLKSTQFYVFWLPGCVIINNIQLRNSTCECIMLTLKSVFLDLSHEIISHLFNFISNITCETPNSRVINVHIRWFLVVIVHLTCDISAMKLHVHK